MRSTLSIVSLLLVLAVVGLLAKSQFGAASKSVAVAPVGSGASLPVTAPDATAQRQSEEIQKQVKQSVEAAMQSPRVVPDDK